MYVSKIKEIKYINWGLTNMIRVLSLDVSSTSTGWAFFSEEKEGNNFAYGVIKTNPKFILAERLVFFRQELYKLLKVLKPTHVVLEDVYLGLNVKVLVVLAKFAGVVEELCFSTLGIGPYIISTNTIKAFFKVAHKEDIFTTIVDIFDWDEDEVTYSKHNDITDALAQLLCYCDSVLHHCTFKMDTDYGHKYEV